MNKEMCSILCILLISKDFKFKKVGYYIINFSISRFCKLSKNKQGASICSLLSGNLLFHIE